MAETRHVISPLYEPAIRFTLKTQIAFTVVAVLMLDRGQFARTAGVAMLGFWIGSMLLIIRRPQAPTDTDVMWLRWGFFAVFIAASFVGMR